MRFEWDERKAASNRSKHGISFELAITAFDDPFALLLPIPPIPARRSSDGG